MPFYTSGQAEIFTILVVSGAVIGLWYDMLAFVRRILEAGFLLSLAADLVFGAGAAACLILASLRACYGEIRPYMLLGALVGYVLYQAGLRRALKAPIRLAARGVRKIRRCLTACEPIKRFFR